LERVEHVQRLFESNRVHRSIGVSVVRLNDLQHSRAEPLPRLRRRRGSAELSDAFPMSSLTGAGKLRKSRLADPTQCSGFSSEAGTRRTSWLSLFWDIQASEHLSLVNRMSAFSGRSCPPPAHVRFGAVFRG